LQKQKQNAVLLLFLQHALLLFLQHA
jgi:hypothetical protein